MKNYLLKITSVSILCFSLLVSCSSDDDSSETGTLEDASELNLTNCFTCPSFTLEQRTASNPEPITTTTPAGMVCKGDDGKAYIDGELNDLNQSFEEYLRIRQMFSRCTAN